MTAVIGINKRDAQGSHGALWACCGMSCLADWLAKKYYRGPTSADSLVSVFVFDAILLYHSTEKNIPTVLGVLAD